MTLSLDVLRLITQQALLNKTWAMDRVYDLPSMATDVRLEEDDQPFIAIYVDDADIVPVSAAYPGTDDDVRIDIMGGADTVRLILEIAVGSPRSATADDTDDRPDMGGVSRINATDPALELQMGLVTRQALQALLSTNTSNMWSELWRHWVISHKKTEIRRGGPGQETTPGVRFASRLVVLHLSLIGEPVRGDDLDRYPAWKAFLGAAEATPMLAGTANLIRAHIERDGGPLPGWRIAQKQLATTRSVMVGIGEGPIDGYDETVPIEIIPTLTEIQTEDRNNRVLVMTEHMFEDEAENPP